MEIIRLTIVILGVQTTCGIPLLSGVERSKAASWEEIVEEAQSFHAASLGITLFTSTAFTDNDQSHRTAQQKILQE